MRYQNYHFLIKKSFTYIIVVYKHTGPAFFRGIPVIYEPGGVYGSKHPAVSAKQVHQQQRADNA